MIAISDSAMDELADKIAEKVAAKIAEKINVKPVVADVGPAELAICLSTLIVIPATYYFLMSKFTNTKLTRAFQN